jgi:hypothetical protein
VGVNQNHLQTEEVKVSIVESSPAHPSSNLLPYVPPMEKDSLEQKTSSNYVETDSLSIENDPYQQQKKLEGMITKVAGPELDSQGSQ